MEKPTCTCLPEDDNEQEEVFFHTEIQDTNCDGWKRLSDLVDEATHDEREEFAPFAGMKREEAAQIVTLPSSIGKLQAVKRLVLYGSYLVRIPPEIGEMTCLEEFTPYTSWRLHWLPYEITRCANLKTSTVSTRKLYGNFKYRPPFPVLPVPAEVLTAITDTNLRLRPDPVVHCSHCGRPCMEPLIHQVWISLLVATDVLPLLVNACSPECVSVLPTPERNYVQVPHTGGLPLKQPAARW